MKKKKDFNEEGYNQAYLKDCQIFKNFFSHKRNLFITILILIAIIVLATKYKTPLEKFETNNIKLYGKVDVSNIDQGEIRRTNIKGIKQGNKEIQERGADEQEAEKLKIVAEFLGDHKIKFGDQNLIFSHYSSFEENVLSAHYADNIFNYYPEREIIISNYGQSASVDGLLDNEILELVKNSYSQKIIDTYFNNDDAYVISAINFCEECYSGLYLTKIFEKDGNVYKITYVKRENKENLSNVFNWVEDGFRKNIPDFIDIDLSYVNKTYNDSLEFKNELPSSNIYKNISWEKKTIKEAGPHANINISYPEFRGFSSASSLNKIISNVILGRLEENRGFIEDWKKDEKSSYIDSEGNVISDCYGEEDYFYACSVNLYSEFKVKSIINNLISIELIIEDRTGGGNGNHSYLKTIVFDLKNNKQVFIEDLFCDANYFNKIKNILVANMISAPVLYRDLNYYTDDILKECLGEVSFNDTGLTLSFSPYIFTPGSEGIFNIFIPYSLLKNDICFNGNNSPK